MRYRVLSGFCVKPGVDAYPGEHVELTEAEAQFRLMKGWIAPDPEPEPHPEAASEPQVVTREPEPESRDPRGKRGRKEEST